MKHNFISVGAVTPKIRVADTVYNTEAICKYIRDAIKEKVKIIVFPELCITGYTCNDLFFQSVLIDKALEGLQEIVAYSKGKDAIIFVGLPLEHNHLLYNVAAVICNGELLGIVPKHFIPNYREFYEKRYFIKGNKEVTNYYFVDKDGNGYYVPFGMNQLFYCDTMKDLVIGVEICEDVWAPNPPSISHALAGATVIINLSASDEITGKSEYRKDLISGQSARLICGYIYANAGEGESTQDLVFSGHNMICENGTTIKESPSLSIGMIRGELDLERIRSERRRMDTFEQEENVSYKKVSFSLKKEELELTRFIDPNPFVPMNEDNRFKRCEEILKIQAHGLTKRLEHTWCKHVVLGISGGLDSTLALLVVTRAFDLLQLDRQGIIAVTMPGFGTTDRTYTNACKLTKLLGATLLEVDIREAVKVHFRDIVHDMNVKDVTYENGQARERTQVLMDIANKYNGLVVGTGDMSELALGWATYNGDHMSMYGVNASVPKTLVKYLVEYYANICGNDELSAILYDILDTPVSPELLPPKEGEIAQKTEDIVGPYQLHDFFLYYVLRFGYSPSRIYYMACQAFKDMYDKDTILHWMKVFYSRFFSQQFKRSCLPDGPKVGSVAVSPRGDLRMPSDASSKIWLDEIQGLEENK